ncbi:RNA exonuclease 4-like [Centruroides vittatus]|uniref:RNA exonuclease 4-like n=1 Tax=Centruroides vittatus TaxID=120091 RepID=UPI003510ABB4
MVSKNSTMENEEKNSKKRKLKNSIIQNKKMKLKKSDTVSNYPRCSSVSSNWQKLMETFKLNPVKQKKLEISKMRKKKGENFKQNSETERKKKSQKTTQDDEIWFDGVDKDLLDLSQRKSENSSNDTLVRSGQQTNQITKVVAMDCEMVGVGEDGKDSMLARVSIVNSLGFCIYDKYVKPKETITDYRTAVSGIRPGDLKDGEEFEVVQKEVYDILKQRILVGHAVNNDLKVLYLDHPKSKIRDTSRYKYFRSLTRGKTPSLKTLAREVLKVKIQEGEHNSVQDAQAAMRLYTMHRKKWEYEIIKRRRAAKKKRVDKVLHK